MSYVLFVCVFKCLNNPYTKRELDEGINPTLIE